MATLDDLRSSVERQRTVVDSAVTLIKGLRDQIAASANDPATIQQLVADLDSKSQELADAISVNTPAEPTV